MNIKLHTHRLSIIPMGLQDASFIQELVNTDGWLQFIGNRNIYNSADAKAYITKIITNPNTDYWTVFLKETAVPVGIITFIKREHLQFSDLGFAFLPQYSNQGYAYEAAAAMRNELIKSREKILAVTLNENHKSIQLLQKLDFKPEGEITEPSATLLLFGYSSNLK
ncbi:N-acetyltransferase [Flavobacterium silvisoli]|uniref:N-acetyltransferase n=1 Tax=Flavobacterium silvisoli TaxID=2529433 RepID=A0A4Q9YU56_9FLAO|nr:GNAT family N-acetyltransferase [Flavobacterium silvisoli]TBX67000.1 N-acetyltransferase [Flavobacterium silvisoli]